MTDLVATCPKSFWREWIAEGDPAGTPWSGQRWGWYINGARPKIEAGDRLYIVAHGRLRGYAPVIALYGLSFDPDQGARPPVGVYVPADHHPRDYRDGELVESAVRNWCIERAGDAVAVTITDAIPGFRGLRKAWWDRSEEVAFPDWQTRGVE